MACTNDITAKYLRSVLEYNPETGLPNCTYIPPDQLAVELGISLKTLLNINRAGDGPPRVKLGRHPYYRQESVREGLRTRELIHPYNCGTTDWGRRGRGIE